MDYQIDSIDRKILKLMRKDSRMAFLEIARELKVSGGTVHGRVKKMKQIGILKGTRIEIDAEKLGYKLSAFVGVQINDASQFAKVAECLKDMDEVLEVHYTTGEYSLFVKILVTETGQLFDILSKRLQTIKGVQSTQSLIILKTLVDREFEV